jgi:hypothetical protein
MRSLSAELSKRPTADAALNAHEEPDTSSRVDVAAVAVESASRAAKVIVVSIFLFLLRVFLSAATDGLCRLHHINVAPDPILDGDIDTGHGENGNKHVDRLQEASR